MTTKYRTKAFVFKKDDKGEADRNFSVFTEDFGKLEIFGKAIRKINSKLRGGIDLFYLSEIEFIQGKNKKTLTDAFLIKKSNISFEISDLLENFLKGQEKDENLWNLILEISKKPNYHYFLWNFLAQQGYKVEVLKCATCAEKLNPEELYFSFKEGGIICKKCLNYDKLAKRVNSDIVKILRIILSKNWQVFSKLKIEPVSQNLLSELSEKYVKILI